MDGRRFYVVRGSRSRGTITYNCPTTEWALRKLRDFKAVGYTDITVTDSDGQPSTEADLVGTADGPGAAPSEETIPAAPQITREPALA